ncbi:acyl-CoA dehydrogenase family protein [Microbulbifer hainanensis]|uniref:acyl-CoA dehydrogenase family protein n=1 Tax=Microbulbifer hainanensis TaxID=2735675 RepID=UPI00186885ED|nr:acyl-CoA dehydrogenase family protein [Microbulbifer hainanensis]
MSATLELANRLSPTGLDSQLSEEEQAVRDSAHRFAQEVLRPIGRELDRMTPEQVIAAESPLWTVFQQAANLGMESLTELPMDQAHTYIALMLEELGWGDAGLAVSLGAAQTPQRLAYHCDNKFLKENIPADAIGCWGITEPDHGSDMFQFMSSASERDINLGRPNCVAKIRGNEVVITGQKSAWVSNGTFAQYCALFCACDTGNGPTESVALVVPLDAKGVSRGKPLDKMGQRALNQGEVYFDNVSLPIDWLIAPPEYYSQVATAQLVEANSGMGLMFTGLARAGFELALDYAHERTQGGRSIIAHQNVRQRLFHMFRQVEASRALARRSIAYSSTSGQPSLLAAISSKITATQTALDVCSASLQMHGGNGLTREYETEKLFRDARASLIEDGCNEVLAIKGGTQLMSEEALSL